MIDITLMALLLKALPQQARLIILGDSQQLASVESGAVFANLCERLPTFSSEFVDLASKCGMNGLPIAKTTSSLCNQVVKLQHSYRFAAGSVIGKLADKINQGDADHVVTLLTDNQLLKATDEATLYQQLMSGYQSFIEAIEHHESPEAVIEAFESFRVLAALNRGPQSVMTVNRLMNHALGRRGWRTQQDFYQGRPILITQNDYRQQLFNGDIGMVLFDHTGQLQVYFNFDGQDRWVPITRLPAHDTAFAMSVHKSQGSEFDSVMILLPNEASPVLCREWLYTAVTRAKRNVNMAGQAAIIKQTVATQYHRESGLNNLLGDLN
jgi:exodeoxyribonuclease V alpha subunit